MSWERYAWFAYPTFGLCLILSVASYLWDANYFWWPMLFVLLACAVMFPLVVVRPLLAILDALRPDAEPNQED
jgi:hypothetical protein